MNVRRGQQEIKPHTYARLEEMKAVYQEVEMSKAYVMGVAGMYVSQLHTWAR